MLVVLFFFKVLFWTSRERKGKTQFALHLLTRHARNPKSGWTRWSDRTSGLDLEMLFLSINVLMSNMGSVSTFFLLMTLLKGLLEISLRHTYSVSYCHLILMSMLLFVRCMTNGSFKFYLYQLKLVNLFVHGREMFKYGKFWYISLNTCFGVNGKKMLELNIAKYLTSYHLYVNLVLDLGSKYPKKGFWSK